MTATWTPSARPRSASPTGANSSCPISGFLPLCHYKNTDYAVFFGAQTTQKPKKYDRPEATANAAISARLPYIMASSRFAHYLKVIARDKIGSFMEASDCESWLNRWIMNYVNANENAGPETKARYPLREARIEVREIPGKPGSYNAVALPAALAATGGTDHQPAHGRAHSGRSECLRRSMNDPTPTGLRQAVLSGRHTAAADTRRRPRRGLAALPRQHDRWSRFASWFGGGDAVAVIRRDPVRGCASPDRPRSGRRSTR